jgi:hypothetical protein
MSYLLKHRFLIIALILTVIGLFWRVEKVQTRHWDPDELNLYNYTRGELLPFWQQVKYGELTSFPGTYVVTYPFVQMFSLEQRLQLNIPHFIAILVGFFAVYLLCRRYLTSWTAWIVVFLVMAFNRNLIYHALELRPYSVLAMLGPMVFYLADNIVNKTAQQKIWQQFLISIFFVTTVAFHAYGFLIVGFSMLFWIVAARFKEKWSSIFKRIWLFCVLTGMIAVPIFIWYATAENKDATFQTMVERFIYTFQFVPDPFEDPVGFLKSIFANLIGHGRLYFLLVVVPLALLFGKDRGKQFLFLLIMVVFPIALICATDIVKSYWFVQRQFVWIMPLFAFYLGWCWQSCIGLFPVARKWA